IWDQLVNQERRRDLADDLAAAYLNKAETVVHLEAHHAPVKAHDQAIAIWERLVTTEGRSELAGRLAVAYRSKAVWLRNAGDYRGALGLYDRAIAIWEQLVNKEGRRDLADYLAVTYRNRREAEKALGENSKLSLPLKSNEKVDRRWKIPRKWLEQALRAAGR